ncbi:MAG: ribonuclease HII [Hymenobacteraceae bacterium]|nr:ribonuclease HII [Hymenobacteraceae bacterium]
MLRSYHTKDRVEAGLDEAGRGCLAGPVVAAAVVLPPNYQHPRLTDSKLLTAKQRDGLRLDITRDAVAWAVAEATVEEIEEYNIEKASHLAMHRAVAALAVRPNHLLVDGNRFRPYPLVPHTCVVRGDSIFLAIAAASILAKTHRDQVMHALDAALPAYGWARNVGYPTAAHRAALREHGPSIHHRRTFRLTYDA